MTFLRTFGFTLIITILFGFLIIKPFLGTTIIFALVIFILIGLVLHYLFRANDIDEAITRISMIYLPSSVLSIILGFTTNLFLSVTEEMAARQAAASGQSFGTLATLFGYQNVILALIALLIGLFGPLYIFRWKEARTSSKQIIWNIVNILLIYLLVFLIHIFITTRFLGSQVLT